MATLSAYLTHAAHPGRQRRCTSRRHHSTWRSTGALGLSAAPARRAPQHAGHSERRHCQSEWRTSRPDTSDHSSRRGRHHAAESFAARRSPNSSARSNPVPGPNRSGTGSCARIGPAHGAGAAPNRSISIRCVSAGRARADGVVPSRASRRSRGAGGAGGRGSMFPLDSRFSLFGAQVAAALGLAVRVCFALRAGADDACVADLPGAIPVLHGISDKPLCDGGLQCIRRADTDEEAKLLATSMQQAFVNLRSAHGRRYCSRRCPVSTRTRTRTIWSVLG